MVYSIQEFSGRLGQGWQVSDEDHKVVYRCEDRQECEDWIDFHTWLYGNKSKETA